MSQDRDRDDRVQQCADRLQASWVERLVARKAAEADTPPLALARLISRDPALSVRVLTFANSCLAAPAEEVHTLREALGLLGRSGLLCAVFAASAQRLHRELARPDVRLWQHAVGCGVAGVAIARHTSAASVEEAFLAGVLHDVGRLAMEADDGERHREVRRAVHSDGRLSSEVEHEVFGFDHTEVGSIVCEHMGLPARVSGAVTAHHDLALASGARAADGARSLAALVQLADRLCLRDGVGRPKPEPSLELADCDAAHVLGLPASELAEIALEFRKLWTDEGQALGGRSTLP